MLTNWMKYFVAATVLSCLVLTDARPNAFTVKSELVAPSITEVNAIVVASSSVPLISEQPSSSAVVEPEEEEEEEEEDMLASIAEEAAEEEAAEEQESSTVETEEGSEENHVASEPVDENIYASSGLIYNKDVDLPVFKQRVTGMKGSLTPIPQVVACRGLGQIAITYSEGPSNATARIARQLNNAQISGNFFVNTKWLDNQDYAIVLQNTYNAGHFIGMTYALPTENPESMSDAEIQSDIIKSASRIEHLIQVAPKYVRLHFSAQSDGRTEHILHDLGFILVGYNLDGKDYVHKSPELVAEEYRKILATRLMSDERKGSFVAIQYDIPETISLEAVPYILQVVQKEGYNAVRMDGCLNDAKPYKSSAAGLEYVADKFSYGSSEYKVKRPSLLSNDMKPQIAAVAPVINKQRDASSATVSTSTSGGMMTLPKNIGFALIPAILYAILCEVY